MEEKHINTDNIKTSEASAQDESKEQKAINQSKIPKYNIYILLLALFGLTYIFTLFIGNILYTPFTVVGGSMQPTLNQNVEDSDEHAKNDIVYISKQTNYDYDDVVVFWAEADQNYLIKRIVAVPGDTISYKIDRFADINGRSYLYYSILINGQMLENSHSFEDMYIQIADFSTYELYQDIINNKSTTLNDNEYFCLGDNRNNSFDSRFLGPVRYDDVLGKVHFVTHYGEGILKAYIRSWFTNEI